MDRDITAKAAGRRRTSARAGGALMVAATLAVAAPAMAQDAKPAASEARRAPLVETVRSVAKAFPAALRLRGVTEAARRVTVSAQTAGLVISEPRHKGERIAKGETLCEIEPGDRAARLAEAKARLAEAEAVAKASSELGKKGFSAETTRARDRAALEAARAAVVAIELDIARTRMTAPFDGWLETDTAELGSLLSLGAPCATLLSLDPIRFVGFPAEGQIGKVKLGQPVEARLLDGRRIRAKISFVARAADPSTRTFRIEARAANTLDTPGGPVRDGATAALFIAYGERMAHQVPRSAIMLDDKGRLGVMLVNEDQARFQSIEVLSDEEGEGQGLWLSGPPTEAEIIVTGQYYVSDGSPVRAARRADEQAVADPSELEATEALQ